MDDLTRVLLRVDHKLAILCPRRHIGHNVTASEFSCAINMFINKVYKSSTSALRLWGQLKTGAR